MTLDDLKVFVAVCESENLSAVARELGCTQPAVSQHVSRLEKELAIPLLERRARGVSVTDAGRLLYEGARDGLDSLSIALRQIEELREGESGTLTIATGGTTVKHFMQGVVVRFRELYPNVQLRFQSANSMRRCVEALRNERADLSFITMGESIRGIEQRPVISMPWVLVVRNDHRLSKRKRIRVRDLKDVPYITLPERSTSQLQLEEALAKEGIQLEAVASVDDWDTAILLVKLGLGAAIAPARHGHNFSRFRGVTPIPISGVTHVTFGWAARRWKSLSSIALDFVDIFHEEMGTIEDIPGLKLHAA